MMLQYQSNPILAMGIPTPQESSPYVDQMMGLYKKYFYEQMIDQLLAKEIDALNKRIKFILDNGETQIHLLMCGSEFKDELTNIPLAKQKGDFLISALTLVHNATKDERLQSLIKTSVDVLQQMNIRLIELEEICIELNSFDGIVDENSDEYKNKMSEIAEYIISSKKTKTGNSIRDLLNV